MPTKPTKTRIKINTHETPNPGNAKLLGILIIIVIALADFIFASENYMNKNNPQNSVGGEKDAYGCLAPAGYSWCESEQRCMRKFEEFCPDTINQLVDSIKSVSGISLNKTGIAIFNWIVGENTSMADASVDGFRYSVQGVKWDDYDKLEKYMNSTYGMDNYNVADGVLGGQRGYYLDYIVCNLNYRHAEMTTNTNGPIKPVGDNLNVTLDCGYFNKNEIPNLLIAQEIEDILATKYRRPPIEVRVTISKQDDTHLVGSVKFGDVSSVTEGGLVLAVKEGDAWKVVFDGNGSIDCNAMRSTYGFSDELLKPNICN